MFYPVYRALGEEARTVGEQYPKALSLMNLLLRMDWLTPERRPYLEDPKRPGDRRKILRLPNGHFYAFDYGPRSRTDGPDHITVYRIDYWSRVREWREARGWRPKEAAQALGVRPADVKAWEAEQKLPSETVLRLMDCLSAREGAR